MSLKMEMDIDLSDVTRQLKNGCTQILPVTSQQVAKDSNYFIPKDTGALESSVFSASDWKSGEVIWSTPYARRLYWNPQYNFSTDVNPNARGLWFEAAKARFLSDWENVAKGVFGL